MKFSDLFVPKYMHSAPDVRMKAIRKLRDDKLLAQIAEKDENEIIRRKLLLKFGSFPGFSFS